MSRASLAILLLELHEGIYQLIAELGASDLQRFGIGLFCAT